MTSTEIWIGFYFTIKLRERPRRQTRGFSAAVLTPADGKGNFAREIGEHRELPSKSSSKGILPERFGDSSASRVIPTHSNRRGRRCVKQNHEIN